jgi:hypothetical protein
MRPTSHHPNRKGNKENNIEKEEVDEFEFEFHNGNNGSESDEYRDFDDDVNDYLVSQDIRRGHR